MIRFILLLVLLPNLLFAEFGIDYLLAGKYPEVVIENHPKGFACGFLLNVDGIPSSLPVIRKLLDSGKCTKIRIHGIWSDIHSFNESDINLAVTRARIVGKLADKYLSTTFYYSPWLEHRASLSLVQKLALEVKKALPSRVKYVNSYIDGGAYLPSEINEVHHSLSVPKGKYIHSWDGLEIMDSDVQKFKDIHSKAEINFFWGFRNNCRLELDDPTKRPDRKAVACADAKYIQSMIAYQETKKIKRNIPSNWIYKSHGEAEILGNQLLPRSEKPVWIIPVKGKSIILKAKGKVFAEFQYEKAYHDKPNYHTYRAINNNRWGYEIAREVKKLKDNSNLNVWIDGKEYGIINPIYRSGSYKN